MREFNVNDFDVAITVRRNKAMIYVGNRVQTHYGVFALISDTLKLLDNNFYTSHKNNVAM